MGFFTKRSKTVDHRVELGLGDVLRRLISLEFRRRNGAASESEQAELNLILEALNTHRVKLNASCAPNEDLNKDGKADSVQFFKLMSETDCCVLNHDAGDKGERL